jgi:hypothetical protein
MPCGVGSLEPSGQLDLSCTRFFPLGQREEAARFASERQFDCTDRAVSLFPDDDLSFALFRILRTINSDHTSILFLTLLSLGAGCSGSAIRKRK